MVCPSALVVIISAEIMLGLHYPVADYNLREFLLDRFISSTDRLQVHFYSALASIFHEVRKEVDTLHSSNFQSKEDLARCWNACHTRNLFQEIPVSK